MEHLNQLLLRKRVVGWLVGLLRGFLGLLYYLWAVALFMGVLEILERLFPWTFLGEPRLLGAVGLLVTPLSVDAGQPYRHWSLGTVIPGNDPFTRSPQHLHHSWTTLVPGWLEGINRIRVLEHLGQGSPYLPFTSGP